MGCIGGIGFTIIMLASIFFIGIDGAIIVGLIMIAFFQQGDREYLPERT